MIRDTEGKEEELINEKECTGEMEERETEGKKRVDYRHRKQERKAKE